MPDALDLSARPAHIRLVKKLIRAHTLEDVETPFGRIEVVRVKSGGILYRQGQIHQSETDGNGVSVSTYIHALYGLLIQAWARNVLLIGCGGGALGTMLSSSGARVTIVDINPVSFAIAHKHFGLPDSIPCHVADGAEFLARPGRKFDAIVLDAYNDGDLAPYLTAVEVLKNAAARLTRSGIFLVNVYLRDDDDERAAGVAARATHAWPDVRRLDEPGAALRNSIVMAGRVAALRPPELILSPRTDANEIKAELRRLVFV